MLSTAELGCAVSRPVDVGFHLTSPGYSQVDLRLRLIPTPAHTSEVMRATTKAVYCTSLCW